MALSRPVGVAAGEADDAALAGEMLSTWRDGPARLAEARVLVDAIKLAGESFEDFNLRADARPDCAIASAGRLTSFLFGV